MKAISLWQPWASAMAYGWKTRETRHWATSYRGPLIIHAAKKVDWFPEALSHFEGMEKSIILPTGCLLCKVNLIGCLQCYHHNEPDGVEFMFGNYASGRYQWITTDLETFKTPIPWKGKQGFFDIPDSVIEEALGEI